MYKLKTKQSIKNRFFKAINNKILYYNLGFCHNLRKKTTKQKRFKNKKQTLQKLSTNFYTYCFSCLK